jgi:hypothetical protein
MFQIVIKNCSKSSLPECLHRMFHWTKEIDRDLFALSIFNEVAGLCTVCYLLIVVNVLSRSIPLSSAEMSAHSLRSLPLWGGGSFVHCTIY